MAQVQIKLLFGRATWANFPPQDSAPTKEQLIEEWLPTYMQSTRFVWENLLDPVLFSSVGSYNELNDEACGSTVEVRMLFHPCLPHALSLLSLSSLSLSCSLCLSLYFSVSLSLSLLMD